MQKATFYVLSRISRHQTPGRKDLKEFVENLQELFKDRRQMTSSELSEKNFVNSKSEGLAYSLHKTRRTFPDFPVFCIPYEICVVRNLF